MKPERSPTIPGQNQIWRWHEKHIGLTRNAEWEIQACKHDRDENPPAEYAGGECKGPARSLQPSRGGQITIAGLEVGAAEAWKGEYQGKEDHEEHEVGSKRANEEDEGHDAHAEEEKT